MYKALLPLLLLFAACNPVNRVLKDEKKTQAVVASYVKGWVGSDIKIDTVFTPGDTLQTLLINYDTVRVRDTMARVDTVKITKTQTVYKYKTDTLRITMPDIGCQNALRVAQKLAQDQGFGIKNAEADKKAMKVERNKWRLYFWLLIAAICLATGAFLYVKLKKP